MKRLIVFPILLIALFGLMVTVAPNINTTFAKSAQATAAPILSVAELKYKLLDHFGTTPDSYPGSKGVFFCDGYLYPVGHPDDEDAIRYWPEITKTSSAYQTILKHLNLLSQTTFTDADKLAVYRECRKLSGTQLDLSTTPPSFNLRILTPTRRDYIATGTISWQGEITILKEDDGTNKFLFDCPLCLVEGTLIDTPNGAKPVESLTVGMKVWSVDYTGQRIATDVWRVAKYPAGAGHQVIEIKLADGRTVTASLGHPLTDGKLIGDVKVGDTVDGSQVTVVTIKTYAGNYTYDVLPTGTLGFYWANGILLGSTLKIICN